MLAVRPPVIDGASFSNSTVIEASSVDAAAWSPIAPHLAFTSESDTRHLHSGEGEDLDLVELQGYEVPGQLYLYENYQPRHEEAQERLAYPRPDIDDNFVRDLKWSEDGQYIAYARGEENTEGAYNTSLWVTFVDGQRDETTATIDNNTRLLLNLRGSDEYFTDFIWAPDGRGLLVAVQTNNGTELRFVTRQGTSSVTVDTVANIDFDKLSLFGIGVEFSSQGNYFAYQTSEEVDGSFIPSLYIQSVAGGDPIKVNIPFSAGASIWRYEWSPEGNILAYLARAGSGGIRELHLTDVNGNNQSWNVFLTPGQSIRLFSIKNREVILPNF